MGYYAAIKKTIKINIVAKTFTETNVEIAKIKNLVSVVFADKYRTASSFEMKLNLNEAVTQQIIADSTIQEMDSIPPVVADIVTNEYLIIALVEKDENDDLINPTEYGIIEAYESETPEDGAPSEIIVLSGYTIEGLFDRVVAPPFGATQPTEAWLLDDNRENIISELLDKQLINPHRVNVDFDDSYFRKLLFLNLVTSSQGRGGEANKTYFFEILLEEIEKQLLAADLGMKSSYNFTTNKCDLSIYKGVDRSASQEASQRVILSIERQNIRNQNIVTSRMDSITVAISVTKIFPDDPREYKSTEFAYGGKRKEQFIFSGIDIVESDGLEATNEESLSDGSPFSQYDAEFAENNIDKIGTTFEIGDIITLEDTKFQRTFDERITEVTKIIEEGTTVSFLLAFGDIKRSGDEEIKKRFRNIENTLK